MANELYRHTWVQGKRQVVPFHWVVTARLAGATANYVSSVQVNNMRWETRHYQLSQAKAVNIAIIAREVSSLASGVQGKTFLRKINYL